MDSTSHHLLSNAIQTTRLHTQVRPRLAVSRHIDMDQARPALGAEKPVRASMPVRPTVNGDGTLMWWFDFKVWEDGCHSVCGRGLVPAFSAVAHIKCRRRWRGSRESDLPALAMSLHCEELNQRKFEVYVLLG